MVFFFQKLSKKLWQMPWRKFDEGWSKIFFYATEHLVIHSLSLKLRSLEFLEIFLNFSVICSKYASSLFIPEKFFVQSCIFSLNFCLTYRTRCAQIFVPDLSNIFQIFPSYFFPISLKLLFRFFQNFFRLSSYFSKVFIYL